MKVSSFSLRFIFYALTIVGLGGFALKASAESQQVQNQNKSRIDTFSKTSKRLAEIRSDFQKRSQEFSLEDATYYAISHNPTIQAAYKGVQSEQWRAISDKRLWWPTVSGAGPMGDITTIPTFPLVGQRYSSLRGGSFSTSTTPSQSARSFTVLDALTPGIQAQWTFFNLSRGAKINSSAESAKAEELLFNLSARDLVLDIHRDYYKLYSIRQYLNNLEQDYSINLAQLVESENKYKRNPSLKNLNTVQQNKSTLYSQLEELIQQHVHLMEAATKLSSNMGLPLKTLARPISNFELRPLGSWPLKLMPTIEHALNHREEIKIAQTRARSTSYLATSLKYSYAPKLSLYGYAGYTSQHGINGMPDTNKYNGSYLYGPEANIGLKINWHFDGTVAAAKAKSLEYQSKKFLAEAQSHRDNIEAQAATAFTRYTTAKMTLDTSSAALKNALNARQTNMQLYKQDQISASSYSTAATAVAVASRRYNKSIFNYNNSISELYRYTAIWPSGISKPLDQAVLVMKSN